MERLQYIVAKRRRKQRILECKEKYLFIYSNVGLRSVCQKTAEDGGGGPGISGRGGLSAGKESAGLPVTETKWRLSRAGKTKFT